MGWEWPVTPKGVAPFTGAWIEMRLLRWLCDDRAVAPFTGAWIEIHYKANGIDPQQVAPFTGAWIEISAARPGIRSIIPSLPSRERGLKFHSAGQGRQ